MSPLETCAVCGLALTGRSRHILRMDIDGRNSLHLALCVEHVTNAEKAIKAYLNLTKDICDAVAEAARA